MKMKFSFEVLENRSMMAAYIYADREVSSLIAKNYSDKFISRSEAIEVFKSVADNGGVDSRELADVRNFVNLNMSEDVRYFSKSMLNNPANKTVRPLANGSTTDNVFKLIDKWFLGKDRPVASTETNYRLVIGNLFVDGVSPTDVRQGNAGDCYFLSVLSALAAKNKTTIQQMFKDNKDSTWTVTFYMQSPNGSYVKEFVTVDNYLPTSQSGSLYYAGFGDNHTSSTNELWVPLAEKAYAQWSETGHANIFQDKQANSYENIGRRGWSDKAFVAVAGKSSTQSFFVDEKALQKALSENKAVVIYKYSNEQRTAGHAYYLKSYSQATNSYELYNPWGNSLTMNRSELKSCYGYAICNKIG